MKKKRRSKSAMNSTLMFSHPCDAIAKQWLYRTIIELGAWRLLIENARYCNDGLISYIGLGDIEDDLNDMKRSVIFKLLKEQSIIVNNHDAKLTNQLEKNLSDISKLIDLNKVEKKILTFAVILSSHSRLQEICDLLGDKFTAETIIQILSKLLQLPVKNVRTALSDKSVLAQSGILKVSRDGVDSLSAKLELMSGFEEVLYEKHDNVLNMLSQYFSVTSKSTLNDKDFPHLKKDMDIIHTYLSNALYYKNKGVNILLYGPPGTGKSEFSRIIASKVRAKLFEVSASDESNDVLTGSERLSAYQLSQKVLEQQEKVVILFDEIEDVFPYNPFAMFFDSHSKEPKKGWINKLLEENNVPSIWISNSINQIDPAFLRRFDFILEIRNPPRSVRKQILHKHLSELSINSVWIDKVSENPHISSAVVARAAKVAATMNDVSQVEDNMERLISHTLEAMGLPKKVILNKHNNFSYCLDSVNADRDMNKVVQTFKKIPKGRLCLYGPPGTGKTEFGRYLSKMIDKPLLVKRASDLLDPYVGMTEKHIANMFEEANDDEAVLLLDEADSFLRDRRGAERSWEVSQVNELLTQMESFDGVFICSTNMIDQLDMASIRRFDLKIHFDYLNTDQNWILFKQVLNDHGVTHINSKLWKSKLSKYTNLTPGDFATVTRQYPFSEEFLTPGVLMDGLIYESNFKNLDMSKKIGFMANI